MATGRTPRPDSNIDMSDTYKLVNLVDGTAADDSATTGQVSALAAQIQSGAFTGTALDGSDDVAVTFSPAFAGTPDVVACARGSSTEQIISVHTVSSTGFKIRFKYHDGTTPASGNGAAYWIAAYNF